MKRKTLRGLAILTAFALAFSAPAVTVSAETETVQDVDLNEN